MSEIIEHGDSGNSREGTVSPAMASSLFQSRFIKMYIIR